MDSSRMYTGRHWQEKSLSAQCSPLLVLVRSLGEGASSRGHLPIYDVFHQYMFSCMGSGSTAKKQRLRFWAALGVWSPGWGACGCQGLVHTPAALKLNLPRPICALTTATTTMRTSLSANFISFSIQRRFSKFYILSKFYVLFYYDGSSKFFSILSFVFKCLISDEKFNLCLQWLPTKILCLHICFSLSFVLLKLVLWFNVGIILLFFFFNMAMMRRE